MVEEKIPYDLLYMLEAGKIGYDLLFNMVEAGSLIVKIPDFQGSFEMDSHSHLLKRVLTEKEFEKDVVELVKKHLDAHKDVLDIGANVGFYTVLFAKMIDKDNKVLAIEPVPSVLEYLHKNIERNHCTQSVLIFEGIATNVKGQSHINIIPGMEEFSSIGKIVHPYVASKKSVSLEVKGDTVDSLVQDFRLRPGFIKIDVEGAEYLVLQGAVNTIRTFRPVIILELVEEFLSSCGATSQIIFQLLQDSGYRLFSTNYECLALPE